MCQGLPASPGVGTGQLVFNSDEAEAMHRAGHKVGTQPVFTSRSVTPRLQFCGSLTVCVVSADDSCAQGDDG